MRRELFFVVIMLLLAPLASNAQDWWEDDFDDYPPIVLELNAWMSEVDGTIKWGGMGVEGTDIDFQEDLGLDAETVNPYVRLNIGMSERWDLRLSFWHTKHDETSPLPRTQSFGGITFNSGVETETTFSMDSYSVMLGYKFIDGEQIDFTVLLGGGAYRVEMEMENALGALSEQTALIPTPLVGVAMNIDLSESLAIRAQVTGMGLSVSDASGEAFDAEAAITWTFYEGLYITGGYKLFRTDVEFDTDVDDVVDAGDFEIKGPFFGLGLVF